MKSLIKLVRPLTVDLGTEGDANLSTPPTVLRLIVLPILLISIVFSNSPMALLAEDTNAVALSGTYSYENNIFDGKFSAPGMETYSRGNFEIEILGSSWVIDYRSVSAITNLGESYIEVISSCDGTNVYVVHHWNPKDVTNPKAVTTDATIYPGALLPSLEADVYRLWVAFLSSTEWTNASGGAKPRASDLSLFYNTNFECSYLWTTNNMDGSVRKLILKSGSRTFGRDIHDNGKLKFFTLPAPYQNGYTMAEGVWRQATNINGVLVPLEFKLSDLTPKQNATSSTDLTVIDHFTCQVTNVYTAVLPPIPVGLQGSAQMVLVDDHRFWQQEHPTLTYAITTNKWQPEVAPNLQARLMDMPKISLENQSLKRFGYKTPDEFILGISKEIIVRILIGTLILLPLVIVVLQGVKRRAKATKQKEIK
jgi:hypothetical protein